MWGDLNQYWQTAFCSAWEGFCRGSVPIGAVIVDEDGRVVAKGRNQIFDGDSDHPLAGTTMAHAEMTALSQLKEKDHPRIRTYTLYSTLEPCPMCFGTIIMMNIRNLQFAGRDGYGGATALKNTLKYIKNKPMTIERGSDEMEVVQITLQSAFECRRNHPRMRNIFDAWRTHCPTGVALGQQLHTTGYLDEAVRHQVPFRIVYDEIIRQCPALS